ncbi:MAG: helix-turn-helix transcriptional regulator [Burkholderiaceae bacterium]
MNLLTIDDITAMAKLSRYHVRDVLVKTPGFPKPVPGTGPRKPRWPETAVRDFFDGKPAQNAHTTPQAS